MFDPLPLLLSFLVSRRELRFSPVPEQERAGDCALAVATTLSGGRLPSSDYGGRPDGGLSLAGLAELLGRAGIPARGFHLDFPALDAALGRDIVPLVLHYDRPTPHWVLLYGLSENLYQLGDPARGFELLDKAELGGRWSGFVLVVDPESLDGSVRAEGAEAAARALSRRMALLQGRGGLAGVAPVEPGGARQGSGDGPRNEPRNEQRAVEAAVATGARLPAWPALSLTLDGELALGNARSLHARLGLDARWGTCSAGLVLPLRLESGSGVPAPEGAMPGLRGAFSLIDGGSSLSLFADLFGAAEADEVGPGRAGGCRDLVLGFAAARLVDPFLLELSLDLALGSVRIPSSAEPRSWSVGLGLSATEAVSERFFLCLGGGIRAVGLPEAPSWEASFELRLTLVLEGFGAGFGLRDRGGRRMLGFTADIALPPGGGLPGAGLLGSEAPRLAAPGAGSLRPDREGRRRDGPSRRRRDRDGFRRPC